MKIRIANLIVIILLCSIVAFSQKEIEFSDTKKVSRSLEEFPTLSAKLSKNQFSATEALELEFTIKNETDYTIVLFDTIPERSFEISVMDDEGNEIPLSETGKKKKCPDIIMGRETVYLVPGKELKWQVNLRNLFEISETGNCFVKVSRRYFIQESNDDIKKNAVISSEAINFKIVK